jgi:predicted porin
MKKTLIAIAALAATGAFAQSTVTISGTLDMGYLNKTTQSTATADTKVSTFGMNNTATSAVNIAITEDLGGGLKAGAFMETNPQLNGSASADGTLVAAGATLNGDSTAAFANGQRWLGLSGASWGGVKLGAANSAVLGVAAATAQPFGTALGGGYSSTFSSTGNGAGMRDIRSANSLRYDSPDFSGFSGSYQFAFNNKNAAGTADVTTGVSVLGLNYSAGPLNVGFATGSYKNGAGTPVVALVVATPGNAGTAAAAAVGASDTTLTHLAANYTFGTTTVYAGMHKGAATVGGVDAGKTSATNFAVKHTMGAISLMANTVARKDKLNAVAADGSLLGLGLDYAMSKRTTTYARYESFDSNKASDATGKRTAMSVGIRHTF